jgi:hypothetical protein
MSTTRERFFECSYARGGLLRTGFVRAWDAASAAATFREMLEREGIRVRGRVSVRDASARADEAGAAAPP